jgi:hypothetical protein
LKKLLLLTLTLGLVSPLSAQIYSYRDAEGRLHITDKLIRDKSYKLVDTYEQRVPEKKRSGIEERNARTPSRRNGKYVLSRDQISGLVIPIAEAMKVLGYVNTFGRGIARAQGALRKNGNPPAEFDISEPAFFLATIRGVTA